MKIQVDVIDNGNHRGALKWLESTLKSVRITSDADGSLGAVLEDDVGINIFEDEKLFVFRSEYGPEFVMRSFETDAHETGGSFYLTEATKKALRMIANDIIDLLDSYEEEAQIPEYELVRKKKQLMNAD